MKATEFFLEYEYLIDLFNDAKHHFLQHSPNLDYHKEIYAITDRFIKKLPLNYLKFGPYWWSVKAIMHAKGFIGYEGETEILLRDAYTVKNPATLQIDELATLMAAWEFKDYYNANYLQGNRDFAIWEDGSFYSLYDIEFEQQFS
ncbi:hypothetical protein [Avibacterium paragallinarum]|uniref:Uncharacterized protein n=2 Tax=Gammaproteobacteria TaxID=1236 RepID=A0A377IUH2_AVIPA|nr:hypothetical protein [Avibacterium paragallinarum]POY47739.1 hypothetical protein C3364_00195 [Avibacterium paragallinarum]QZP14707.1 hypothetical protein K5O18_07585 [Avibacterium paragallinarum]RZN74592.1 hypothetical protein EC523_11820 [Avibacterium paragallinarum]WAM58636.1 hypothetical protein OW731_08725 [Avibacterium paragallinarum]CDG00398.1 Putative uncharacterized protein [Avibacterium paragallinarum JF4211]